VGKNPDYEQAFIRLRSKTTGRWFVHPELRARLVAQAEAEGSNLSEVAIKILADRHGVQYASNGRRTAPKEDKDILNLRLPRPLYDAIVRAAGPRYGAKYQDAIRADLCAHFQLDAVAA
jgi:hypothetical protein